MWEEFEEILHAMSGPKDKMLDWVNKYKDSGVFETDEGKRLLHNIVECMRNFGYLFFDVAAIQVKEL